MKKHIPQALIFSRLAMGLTIVLLSYLHVERYKVIAITLLSIGLLTDILDGIIARYLHISTHYLRRLDAAIDQVFFISVVVAVYRQCPGFFEDNIVKISVLIGAEALTYVISFMKFGKEVATHSIGAKIWTLLLFATLVQVILQCRSGLLFELCFWVGLITRAEIIAILLVLRKWTNDVPSFYHSIKLRRGKEIKRNKLFNG